MRARGTRGMALPLAIGVALLLAVLLAGLTAASAESASARTGATESQSRRWQLDDALATAAASVWRDTTGEVDPVPRVVADDGRGRVWATYLRTAVVLAARHPAGEGAALVVHRYGWPPPSAAWLGEVPPGFGPGAYVEPAGVIPTAEPALRAARMGVTGLANLAPPTLTVLSRDLDIGAGEVVMGCWLVRGAVRLAPDGRLYGRVAVADSLVLADRAQVVGQVVMLSAGATRLGVDAVIRRPVATDPDPCPSLVAGRRVAGGGWVRLP